MKKRMQKIWTVMKKHKICSISLLFVLCAAIVGVALLPLWRGSPDDGGRALDSGITRGEWTALFAGKFGYIHYEETEPYFADVPDSSDIFAQVQTLVEYEIVTPGGKYEPDRIISGNEMLAEIGKAFGKNYVSRRVNTAEPADEQYIEFLTETEASLAAYAVNDGLQTEQVNAMLEIAYGVFLERQYDNFAELEFADGVLDLSDRTYTVSGESYTVESDTPLKEGDIVVLGISQADPDGETIKIETVISSGNQYTITGTQPALDEVFDEFALEINQIATVTEFVPADGVTVTGIDDETGMIDVVWNGVVGSSSGSVTTLGLLSGAEKDSAQTAPLVSGSVNGDVSGTLFDIEGFWNSEGKGAIVSKRFAEIIEQNPFSKNEVEVALDRDGKLISKYESGYEITLGLKVSDLTLNGSAEYKAGVLGRNKQLSFNLNAGITVEPSVSLAGNSNVRLKLGTFYVPVNFVLSINVDVYAVIDINGEITVTTEIKSFANVNKSPNSSKINASAQLDAYTELEANCEMRVLLGPDTTITIAGIPIVDAYILVGAGADMNYTTARPTELDVRVYLPLIRAGVGYNSRTMLSKLGVAAEVNIMDKEGALVTCPYDKTFTFHMRKEETLADNHVGFAVSDGTVSEDISAAINGNSKIDGYRVTEEEWGTVVVIDAAGLTLSGELPSGYLLDINADTTLYNVMISDSGYPIDIADVTVNIQGSVQLNSGVRIEENDLEGTTIPNETVIYGTEGSKLIIQSANAVCGLNPTVFTNVDVTINAPYEEYYGGGAAVYSDGTDAVRFVNSCVRIEAGLITSPIRLNNTALIFADGAGFDILAWETAAVITLEGSTVDFEGAVLGAFSIYSEDGDVYINNDGYDETTMMTVYTTYDSIDAWYASYREFAWLVSADEGSSIGSMIRSDAKYRS